MNGKNRLLTDSVWSLMRTYCLPCIFSLLIAALYNIVDQIFIANARLPGSFGNAANTAVLPITVLALASGLEMGPVPAVLPVLAKGIARKPVLMQEMPSGCLGFVLSC